MEVFSYNDQKLDDDWGYIDKHQAIDKLQAFHILLSVMTTVVTYVQVYLDR